jgi:hypothetical protein
MADRRREISKGFNSRRRIFPTTPALAQRIEVMIIARIARKLSDTCFIGDW